MCYTGLQVLLLVTRGDQQPHLKCCMEGIQHCGKRKTKTKTELGSYLMIFKCWKLKPAHTPALWEIWWGVHWFSLHMMAKVATYGYPRFSGQGRMQWGAIFLKYWSDGWFTAFKRVTLDAGLTPDSWTWASLTALSVRMQLVLWVNSLRGWFCGLSYTEFCIFTWSPE